MTRPYEILLVEDNAADVRLMKEAVREEEAGIALIVARDGREALDLLHARRADPGAALPDLVLVDLNMPRMDGREFLRRVVRDPALDGLPVVVLTSSSAADERAATRELGAKAYYTKPHDIDELVGIVRRVRAEWPRREA